ncbi:hypothetical protein MYX78_01905 [Acidobacteria bacterium AH-259-G07]|nr:hypothetical protein [Acidobacteria bacterium AH-259-G07]
MDIKDVMQEVSFFLRFGLRRKGFVIEAVPSKDGWEVQAELLDPRPDPRPYLSSSYKRVYDQNIYLIRVGSDLKILSCEKIGKREKTGEIRFFPRKRGIREAFGYKAPASPQKREKKVALDPSFVGDLATEISRRVSSSLGGGQAARFTRRGDYRKGGLHRPAREGQFRLQL